MQVSVILQFGSILAMLPWPRTLSKVCARGLYDTDDCCFGFYVLFPFSQTGVLWRHRHPPVESLRTRLTERQNKATFTCKDIRDNMEPQDHLRYQAGFNLFCARGGRRIARYMAGSYEHLSLDAIRLGGVPRIFWKARCDRVTHLSEIMLRGAENDCVDSHPATKDFLTAFGQVAGAESEGMTMTDKSTGRTYTAQGNFVKWPESVLSGHVYTVCSTSTFSHPVSLRIAFTHGKD